MSRCQRLLGVAIMLISNKHEQGSETADEEANDLWTVGRQDDGVDDSNQDQRGGKDEEHTTDVVELLQGSAESQATGMLWWMVQPDQQAEGNGSSNGAGEEEPAPGAVLHGDAGCDGTNDHCHPRAQVGNDDGDVSPFVLQRAVSQWQLRRERGGRRDGRREGGRRLTYGEKFRKGKGCKLNVSGTETNEGETSNHGGGVLG
jgi:hypothetical protein